MIHNFPSFSSINVEGLCILTNVICDCSLTLPVCFQVGPSAMFSSFHQPVQSVWGCRMFVQQCSRVSAAASLPGGHARGDVCVLVHCQ